MDGGSSSIEESAHPYIITGIGAWDMRGSEYIYIHTDTYIHTLRLFVVLFRRDKARPKELNPSDLSVDSLIGQVILSKSHSGGSLGKSISRSDLT